MALLTAQQLLVFPTVAATSANPRYALGYVTTVKVQGTSVGVLWRSVETDQVQQSSFPMSLPLSTFLPVNSEHDLTAGTKVLVRTAEPTGDFTVARIDHKEYVDGRRWTITLTLTSPSDDDSDARGDVLRRDLQFDPQRSSRPPEVLLFSPVLIQTLGDLQLLMPMASPTLSAGDMITEFSTLTTLTATLADKTQAKIDDRLLIDCRERPFVRQLLTVYERLCSLLLTIGQQMAKGATETTDYATGLKMCLDSEPNVHKALESSCATLLRGMSLFPIPATTSPSTIWLSTAGSVRFWLQMDAYVRCLTHLLCAPAEEKAATSAKSAAMASLWRQWQEYRERFLEAVIYSQEALFRANVQRLEWTSLNVYQRNRKISPVMIQLMVSVREYLWCFQHYSLENVRFLDGEHDHVAVASGRQLLAFVCHMIIDSYVSLAPSRFRHKQWLTDLQYASYAIVHVLLYPFTTMSADNPTPPPPVSSPPDDLLENLRVVLLLIYIMQCPEEEVDQWIALCDVLINYSNEGISEVKQVYTSEYEELSDLLVHTTIPPEEFALQHQQDEGSTEQIKGLRREFNLLADTIALEGWKHGSPSISPAALVQKMQGIRITCSTPQLACQVLLPNGKATKRETFMAVYTVLLWRTIMLDIKGEMAEQLEHQERIKITLQNILDHWHSLDEHDV